MTKQCESLVSGTQAKYCKNIYMMPSNYEICILAPREIGFSNKFNEFVFLRLRSWWQQSQRREPHFPGRGDPKVSPGQPRDVVPPIPSLLFVVP